MSYSEWTEYGYGIENSHELNRKFFDYLWDNKELDRLAEMLSE